MFLPFSLQWTANHPLSASAVHAISTQLHRLHLIFFSFPMDPPHDGTKAAPVPAPAEKAVAGIGAVPAPLIAPAYRLGGSKTWIFRRVGPVSVAIKYAFAFRFAFRTRFMGMKNGGALLGAAFTWSAQMSVPPPAPASGPDLGPALEFEPEVSGIGLPDDKMTDVPHG